MAWGREVDSLPAGGSEGVVWPWQLQTSRETDLASLVVLEERLGAHAAREIAGLGVGAVNDVVPQLLAELAPAVQRAIPLVVYALGAVAHEQQPLSRGSRRFDARVRVRVRVDVDDTCRKERFWSFFGGRGER